MSKKGRTTFLKSRTMPTDIALQITSMADIFVIILVFLLKSYASSAVDLQLPKGMVLPIATAEGTAIQALKVEITESAILVESQLAANVEKFSFNAGDLLPNGVSKTLSAAFDHQRQKQMLIAKNNTEVKMDSRIIVVSDQRAPYSTVKSVLASAASNGYTDFKLAVVQKE